MTDQTKTAADEAIAILEDTWAYWTPEETAVEFKGPFYEELPEAA